MRPLGWNSMHVLCFLTDLCSIRFSLLLLVEVNNLLVICIYIHTPWEIHIHNVRWNRKWFHVDSLKEQEDRNYRLNNSHYSAGVFWCFFFKNTKSKMSFSCVCVHTHSIFKGEIFMINFLIYIFYLYLDSQGYKH